MFYFSNLGWNKRSFPVCVYGANDCRPRKSVSLMDPLLLPTSYHSRQRESLRQKTADLGALSAVTNNRKTEEGAASASRLELSARARFVVVVVVVAGETARGSEKRRLLRTRATACVRVEADPSSPLRKSPRESVIANPNGALWDRQAFFDRPRVQPWTPLLH